MQRSLRSSASLESARACRRQYPDCPGDSLVGAAPYSWKERLQTVLCDRLGLEARWGGLSDPASIARGTPDRGCLRLRHRRRGAESVMCVLSRGRAKGRTLIRAESS